MAQEAGDQSLQTHPLYQLGGLHWARGDLARAEQLWTESLTIAGRIGDERAQGWGYNGLGILAICRGQTIEARRLKEYLERLRATGRDGPADALEEKYSEVL